MIKNMEEEIYISDDKILSGTLVFNGTRVPVKSLFDYLETGESVETFLIDFPSVSREQVNKLLEKAEKFIISK